MRAQAAMEFIMLLILSMLLFSGATVYIQNQKINRQERIEILALEDFAYALQQELYVASSMGNGFSRDIFPPDRLSGQQYQLNVLNSTLYVSQGEAQIILALPPTVGNLTPGVASHISVDDGEVVLS